MDAESVNRDFTGTTIKTPMDKMRAMSIIRAKDDPSGLSIINFNITAFLTTAKHPDAFFILGLWATEPVRRSPGKFIRFPHAGRQALATRSDALMVRLSQRPDINQNFIDGAKLHIAEMIGQEVTHLLGNARVAESA